MLRTIAIVLMFLLVIGLVTAFATINPAPVTLELFFASVEMPLWRAVAIFFTAGIVVGLVCSLLFGVRLLNERRKLKRSVRVAEAEVANLRTLPMHDAD